MEKLINEEKTTVIFRGKPYSAIMGIHHNTGQHSDITMVGGSLSEPIEEDKLFNLIYDALYFQYAIENYAALEREGIYPGFMNNKVPSHIVSALTGARPITVRKYALANGIHFDGPSHRRTYYFTYEDIQTFIKRPRPGKRARKS